MSRLSSFPPPGRARSLRTGLLSDFWSTLGKSGAQAARPCSSRTPPGPRPATPRAASWRRRGQVGFGPETGAGPPGSNPECLPLDTPPAKAERFLAGQPASHGSTKRLNGAFAPAAVVFSPDYTKRLSLCGQCHDASYSGCPEILPVRCLEALVRPLLRGALPKQLLRARSGGVASALPLVSQDITDAYQYRECFATLNEKSPRTDRFICPG